MNKENHIIIVLLFVVIVLAGYFFYQVMVISTVVKGECNDDFEVMDRCNCVPCSWEDAEKYNGNNSCERFR